MKINWISTPLDPNDGYGYMNLQFIETLLKQNVLVKPSHYAMLESWMEMPLYFKYLNPVIDFDAPTISLMSANVFQKLPNHFGFTMYETSQIPDGWADRINESCDHLIVPCYHNERVFRKNGVEIPIHIIPGGVKPASFPMVNLPKRDKYTFVCIADRNLRKGVDIVMTAFAEAFSSKDPVKLIVKSRSGLMSKMQTAKMQDMDIQFIDQSFPSMFQLYAMGDVFVMPSRGEGWGMPPREAACMGIPVIVSRNTGLEMGIEGYATRIIEKYTITEAHRMKGGGEWLSPDVNETAEHMRWCFDNQEEAKFRGIQAGQWIQQNQTWDHAVLHLRNLLQSCAA